MQGASIYPSFEITREGAQETKSPGHQLQQRHYNLGHISLEFATITKPKTARGPSYDQLKSSYRLRGARQGNQSVKTEV